MESPNTIEGFDPEDGKYSSIEPFITFNRTRPTQPQRGHINRPTNIRPDRLPGSPMQPPDNIKQEDWGKWWRENRRFYGDRDYYIDLNYPIWWIDYYFPLYDIGNDFNYYYDYPITYPPTISYPMIETSLPSNAEQTYMNQKPTQPSASPMLVTPITFCASACCLLLILILLILI
jgi:hypothetical protein